jgi:hypothetical protein
MAEPDEKDFELIDEEEGVADDDGADGEEIDEEENEEEPTGTI